MGPEENKLLFHFLKENKSFETIAENLKRNLIDVERQIYKLILILWGRYNSIEAIINEINLNREFITIILSDVSDFDITTPKLSYTKIMNDYEKELNEKIEFLKLNSTQAFRIKQLEEEYAKQQKEIDKQYNIAIQNKYIQEAKEKSLEVFNKNLEEQIVKYKYQIEHERLMKPS